MGLLPLPAGYDLGLAQMLVEGVFVGHRMTKHRDYFFEIAQVLFELSSSECQRGRQGAMTVQASPGLDIPQSPLRQFGLCFGVYAEHGAAQVFE